MALLQRELGTTPDAATLALRERIAEPTEADAGSERTDAAGRRPTAPPHNLPEPTTGLVGRGGALSELDELLADTEVRLVTVLGPGGMGKTRLAVEVARQQLSRYRDGVFFVPLAGLRAADRLAAVVAAAVGFRFADDDRSPERQLADYLRRRHLLLVLDSLEHLKGAAVWIQDLLEATGSLRILGTSRERLQLTSESVYPLGSLDFPTWETPADAQELGAVRLFIEAGRRADAGFDPGPEDLRYVARICRLVGGMPLGILLAAAWVGVLSPAQIAAELTRNLDLLDSELRDLPERQRNMRTVLAASWKRLTEEERRAFAALSVLRGGFDTDAATAITGAPLRTLAHLVDKSFLQHGADGRYQVHELLRQFGAEALRAGGREAEVRQRHSAWFLRFVADREAHLADRRQDAALAQLTTDFDNIRAAWRWAVRAGDHAGIDAALDGLFRWFWLVRSRQAEGQALVRHALEAWEPAPGEQPSRVWLRLLARRLEQQGPWLSEPLATRARIERALEAALQRDDRTEVAFCRWALGLSLVSDLGHVTREDTRRAVELYEMALASFQVLADGFLAAHALEGKGHAVRTDASRSIPVLQASLELRRAAGDRHGMARSVRELGFTYLFQGRDADTARAWREAHELQTALGDPYGIADSLYYLGVLVLIRGDWEDGRRKTRQVEAIAEELGNEVLLRSCRRLREIADAMESTAVNGVCPYPASLSPFTATLWAYLHTEATLPVGYRKGLFHCLDRAAADAERGILMPFVARLLARDERWDRAVQYLALASTRDEVTQGWIGRLAEVVGLRDELAARLSTEAFEAAWREGAAADLTAAAAAAREYLRQPDW